MALYLKNYKLNLIILMQIYIKKLLSFKINFHYCFLYKKV